MPDAPQTTAAAPAAVGGSRPKSPSMQGSGERPAYCWGDFILLAVPVVLLLIEIIAGLLGNWVATLLPT